MSYYHSSWLNRTPYYTSFCVPNAELAHAYVPFQNLTTLYPPMKGLDSGTIFPELHRPYGADKEYTVDA